MRIPKIIQDYEDNKISDTSSMMESGFDYHFDISELKSIAMFMRRNQGTVPAELLKFQEALEQKIYNSMTISEVMNFYSQGK